VSAAIGYSSHTFAVWCLFIVVHCPFRFQLARSLNNTYKLLLAQIFTPNHLASLSHEEFGRFVRIRRCLYASYALNRIEIIGLLILSIFNSNFNFGKWYYCCFFYLKDSIANSSLDMCLEMHKLGFVIYLICGASFKVLVCIVELRLKSENSLNQYVARKRLAVIFISCFVVCMFLYEWHNSTCQSYG
jgi:hypothetical protein